MANNTTDSNTLAEIENGKGEYLPDTLERARNELAEKHRASLKFDTIVDALCEMDEKHQNEFVKSIINNKREIVSHVVCYAVSDYIAPDNAEIMEQAASIESDDNDRRGCTI